jgi:glutamate racemase
MSLTDPIGVFDSGVGGLSVLRCIREELPHENLIYIADSGHAPYGDKPQEYIEQRSITLAGFLLEHRAKAIVVACNTATAAAIATLRASFSLPIIGLEPGLKPALTLTRAGVVGILATRMTLGSRKFEDLVNRFGRNCKLVVQECPGLVEQVEQMDLTGRKTRQLLENYVSALLDHGADTIVLGCTHYPFLTPLIQEIAGPDVSIVDTGAAVAKEVSRRLREAHLLSDYAGSGYAMFWTTDKKIGTAQVMQNLWPDPVQVWTLPRAADRTR